VRLSGRRTGPAGCEQAHRTLRVAVPGTQFDGAQPLQAHGGPFMQVPLQLTLASSEVTALSAPPALYVSAMCAGMLHCPPDRRAWARVGSRSALLTAASATVRQVMGPRLGYLPTVAAQAQAFFRVRRPSGPPAAGASSLSELSLD